MCGIAGIIAPLPPDQARINACAQFMAQRGPDAQGVVSRAQATLIFRRLAIIDLSPAGNQPMSNETGEVWIVFNGEIYNYAELRAELAELHQFRSKTDTEVLVHGYEQWGLAGLVQRIDGMFAFAIWDETRQKLFLARDRVGKKPLYYTETKDGFAFSSTLNALVALLPEKPVVDPVALDEYLVYQAVPAPRTIFAGVHMLPPAHCAVWSAQQPHQGLQLERYWQLSYQRKIVRDERDLLEELDTILRAAVQRRLISDVPLGAFLSGGVDSGLIVSIMSALGAGPVEAVHIGFDDPKYDERPLARDVARGCGAKLHEHVMSPQEVFRLPEIVWQYGQPMADVSIVPTYAVARAAREHVTVVLNGDGGDEAFAGYARPIVARAAERFRECVPARLQRVGSRIVSFGGKRGRMLATAASRGSGEAFTYDRGLRTVRDELYSPAFMDRLGDADPDEHYRDIWESADGPTDADRALYGDLSSYLPDQLLTKMDVSTMAHSVEARSPLLDTRVLEFAATIPSQQLTRGFKTKYLLKQLAERYIPRHVIHRRKRGFVMPASEWLRGPLSRITCRLLTSDAATSRGIFRPAVLRNMLDEHVNGRRNWGAVLWTALVLEVWHRLFIDGTLTASETLEVFL